MSACSAFSGVIKSYSRNWNFVKNGAYFSSSKVNSEFSPFLSNRDKCVDDKRARLLYQSRKRGMLENDLLLSTFAGKFLQGFNSHQLDLYDKLINLPSNDWDIYYWATGAKETPPEYQNEVMELFKSHVRNENKETRFVQPDLHS